MSLLPVTETTPRVDLYAHIHKALRVRLCDLLCRTGRCDGSDDEDTAALLADLRETLTLLQRHMDLENRFLHPALDARRPGASRETAHTHGAHARDIDELLAAAFRLQHLPALRRAPLAAALYRALGRFVAEELAHMDHEESVLNRVLWETHSDAELCAIDQALRADLSAEESALSLRVIMPSLTPGERAGRLLSMREKIPAPAFAQTLAAVMPLLAPRARQQLETALGIERRPADFVGLC